jgi:hypothetical protein
MAHFLQGNKGIWLPKKELEGHIYVCDKKEMYSWKLMVHGYLYCHSNHLSKLKCELNLPQTPPPTHARTRMATLAFLQSPQTNDTHNVAIG